MFPIVEHTLILQASVQDGVVSGHVWPRLSALSSETSVSKLKTIPVILFYHAILKVCPKASIICLISKYYFYK